MAYYASEGSNYKITLNLDILGGTCKRDGGSWDIVANAKYNTPLVFYIINGKAYNDANASSVASFNSGNIFGPEHFYQDYTKDALIVKLLSVTVERI